MTCPYCGGKTEVTNSRHQKRINQVWRRRHCYDCGATFTTHESTSYEDSWRVRGSDGSLIPFLRYRLFLSLHKSLEHRENSVEDAGGLMQTILSLLNHRSDTGLLEPEDITLTVHEVLKNFDNAAATHYAAFHKIRD
jgi:transcriptional regulator NrdR family protein